MEWLTHIEFWHWLVVAVVLISIEMLIVGTYYFLWMSLSAVIVGGIMYFYPGMSWLAQVLTFTILSVLIIVFFKRYQTNNPVTSDEPALNRRGEQYIGRVFTLSEAIVNGVGKVKVDDSIWKVSGEDMETGAKVRVVAIDGTIFKVEAV